MTFSNNTHDNIVPDVEDIHSSTAKFATIAYLAIMALLGTVGNLLVILTVVKTIKFRRLTYILIANLSVVGLLVCIIIIPSHIINIIKVGKIHSDTFLCEVEGYLNFMLTLAMIGNSNAITLNRYLIVNRQQVTSVQTERTRNVVIILVMLWLVPIVVAFSSLPFTGYHAYILDCFFLISDNAYWYVIAIISSPGIFTTVLISVCYTLILRKVRKSRLKVTATLMKRSKNNEEAVSTCSDIPSDIDMNFPQPSTSTGVCCTTETITDLRQNIADTVSVKKQQYKLKGDKSTSKNREQTQTGQVKVSMTSASRSLFSNSTGQSQISLTTDRKSKKNRLVTAKFQQEIRLTLQLLLVFALFCFLYMPMCVVHILHVMIPVSPDLWLTLFTLALSFSTTTWMLYGVLNRDFRKAYANIIGCKK